MAEGVGYSSLHVTDLDFGADERARQIEHILPGDSDHHVSREVRYWQRGGPGESMKTLVPLVVKAGRP
jgi:hypothetical protein